MAEWHVEPVDGDPRTWIVGRREDPRAQRTVVGAVDARGNVWLRIDGRTCVMPAPGAARPSPDAPSGAGAGPATLTSPMPATVTRVAVTTDDRVRAGDTLLLLEAMKMEVPLRAPHDGVVADVRCAVGDLVQPGVPLVVLHEGTDDDAA